MEVALEADVVRRAQAGDRSAFAQLYDTYMPKIHDLALGVLRNRTDAEGATSDTFLKAVERLPSLKNADAFRGWLYTIARNSALDVIESRKRAGQTAVQDETATPDPMLSGASLLGEPDAEMMQRELRELMWDAAATLNPRDSQVFELAVRHGLGSAEVADVLGMRLAYASILVSRLKASVGEALEAIVLSRAGRIDCAELDALLVRYGEAMDSRTRKAVNRHATSCAVCVETKRTKTSVPALLARTAFAAPSAASAAELAAKIDEAWNTTGPGAHPRRSRRGRAAATFAATMAALLVLSAGLVGATPQRTIHRAEIRGRGATPSASPSATPAPTPELTPEPTPEPSRRPTRGR